jgi:hypothetical protein
MAEGVTQVAESLPRKSKALSSNPGTEKKIGDSGSYIILGKQQMWLNYAFSILEWQILQYVSFTIQISPWHPGALREQGRVG